MQTHLACPLRGPVTKRRNSWAHTPFEEKSVQVPSMNDSDIRSELVQRVRREIAEGTYDTPEKFEIALDRLLDRLERD